MTRRATDNTKALDAFLAAKIEIDAMMERLAALSAITADIGPEGWIGNDDVETARKNPVNVDQTIVVVDAAMAIAMHNHIHFGSASGARFRVAAEDAFPRESTHPSVDWFIVVA